MKTTREAFLQKVLSRLGFVVVWAQKGPELFDCSGLVTRALWELNCCDWRATFNANALFEAFPATSNPKPGDLAFWSSMHAGSISHVAVVMGEPQADSINKQSIISADGATPTVNEAMAKESVSCRVRVHSAVSETGRMYFRGFRTNTHLE